MRQYELNRKTKKSKCDEYIMMLSQRFDFNKPSSGRQDSEKYCLN